MLTIYGVPISVHTRKPLVAALHKKLKFKNEPVIPFDPPANWRALSPTGLIPAMTHDGLTLGDSTSICLYLEKIKPAPPLYPSDAKAFAQAIAIEQFAGHLFKKVIHPLFFEKVIKPGILKQGEPDQSVIDGIISGDGDVIFAQLEDFLATKSFGGGALSIADVAIASNLVNFHYLGFTINQSRHPALQNFFERTIATPAFAEALTAERPFAAQMGLDGSFIK